MQSLYLLIPIALAFAGLIIWLLIWSVNRGQYDDLERDAWRALNDDLDSRKVTFKAASDCDADTNRADNTEDEVTKS